MSQTSNHTSAIGKPYLGLINQKIGIVPGLTTAEIFLLVKLTYLYM